MLRTARTRKVGVAWPAAVAGCVGLTACLIIEPPASSGGDCDDVPPCTVTAPPECPEPPVTWEDVGFIFEHRCGSCHDGTGEEWPLLDYGEVAAWTHNIRTELLDCNMPPPEECSGMKDVERERILTWILCGAKPAPVKE